MTRQEKRTYAVWYSMMSRCYRPHCTGYQYYGGEGIEVCKKWHDYYGFLADMGLKPDGMTLERRNNDGPYELANCLWATYSTQARNRRSNVMLTYNGRTLCVADWALELGLPPITIYARIRRGCSIERTLYAGDLDELDKHTL
jgi:hypothetical protein